MQLWPFFTHRYGTRERHSCCSGDITIIWLVVEPTPLKNDGVHQLGWLFPIYGTKTPNVPNHQPDNILIFPYNPIYIYYTYIIHILYIYYTYIIHILYIYYTYIIHIYILYIYYTYIYILYIYYTYIIHILYIYYTYIIHILYIYIYILYIYYTYIIHILYTYCIIYIYYTYIIHIYHIIPSSYDSVLRFCCFLSLSYFLQRCQFRKLLPNLIIFLVNQLKFQQFSCFCCWN